MDMGRFLIEVHLRTGKPIEELARAHDVHPSWLFKLLRRYRLEGPTGLEPRSRRPKSSPSRIADLYEDEIVALRKELADAGFDAGAATIHFHLSHWVAATASEASSTNTIGRPRRALPPVPPLLCSTRRISGRRDLSEARPVFFESPRQSHSPISSSYS